MSAHDREAPAAVAFRAMSAALNGLSIEDCQDASVGLLSSVIVQHYRGLGMPLDLALECADAAIADVKENIRTNWNRP